MLRSLVLLLMIVNAAFFGWSKGWLKGIIDIQPDSQHEPQRLGKQIHAEQIMVTVANANGKPGSGHPATSPLADGEDAEEPAQGASAPDGSGDGASSPFGRDARMSDTLSTTPPAASGRSSPQAEAAQCLEAGPFTQAELSAVEPTLRPILPAGSWSTKAVTIQGLWLVYMGPYADPNMLQRKQAELRHIKGLDFEEVRTPASLAQGISLGRYNRLPDAEAGLTALRNRGIRTAHVVNVRPNMEVKIIRVDQATTSTRNTLESIKLPEGKSFVACRP
jgi:hypothetical protein